LPATDTPVATISHTQKNRTAPRAVASNPVASPIVNPLPNNRGRTARIDTQTSAIQRITHCRMACAQNVSRSTQS
jgi:hypothetical protein